jgi:23S rRNA (uracil1939-C5)-methyltransferase
MYPMEKNAETCFSGRKEEMVLLLKTGDSVLVRTEKTSSDGSALARTPEGLIVFIPGGLPGETIRARISVRKKEYAIAVPEEVTEPHVQRRNPFCPVFGLCGGCQLQHAAYSLQLMMKQSIVRDAFERIYKKTFPDIPPCIPAPQETGYRNKTSFPVRKVNGRAATGYFAPRSHDIVPVNTCPVAARRIDGAYSLFAGTLPALALPPYDEKNGKGVLRHAIFRQSMENQDVLVSLVIARPLSKQQRKLVAEQILPVFRDRIPGLRSLTLNLNPKQGNVIVGRDTEILYGDGLVEEILSPFRLLYDTTAFFQVNSRQALALYEYVEKAAVHTGDEHVLELFSGAGSLTVFLARSARHVTAVEEWDSAVLMMNGNLGVNGLAKKTTLLSGAVEKVVPSLERNFNVVVLDPPRTGCDASVLKLLLSSGPDRIVYVSCNPATLARDGAILSEGGYSVESLSCFDMFPQTVHVETVAVFVPQNGSCPH